MEKGAVKKLPSAVLPPAALATRSPTIELFEKPVQEDLWEDAEIMCFGPTNVVEGEKITFNIPKLTGRTFMDLGRAFFTMNLKLEDKDGKPPPTLDDAGNAVTLAPCDAFCSAMFTHVKISIGEVPLTSG